MGIRLAVVLVLLAWQSVVHAATFMVTNTNDDEDPGSLRAAINDANDNPGNNTITIKATGIIVLVNPLIVTSDLMIMGPGANELTIQGSAVASPVLTLNSVVQLSGVTITGATSSGNGGGIVVGGGSLDLRDSVITGNTALSGSAIYSTGTLTIRRSTISANIGTGAVFGGGDTTVNDSTIADNKGTAIVFSAADKTLTINRSTISGNTDTTGIGSEVGGLQLQAGTANLHNSTLSGNSGSKAGELWAVTGTSSLGNVTITGASEPALLLEPGSTVTLRNTLLGGTGKRCSGSLPTSEGHNLSSDATCNLIHATDKPGVDPMLGPLAMSAGTTKTHALLAGSPAVNAGDGTLLDTLVDQRGEPRIQFGAIDIGAVEVTEPVVSTQPAPQTLVEGGSFMLTVAANNQNSTTSLKFQWRKDGTPIPGAIGDTLTKADAKVEDSGTYDVLVINEGGSLPSIGVTVTVTAAVKGDNSFAGDGGGCCSSTRDGAWYGAVLGLVLVMVLGIPRRRRAAGRTRRR